MPEWILQLKRALNKLTPLEMITAELAEAELSVLEHQTAMEYHRSIVEYNETRIRRLRQMVTGNVRASSV